MNRWLANLALQLVTIFIVITAAGFIFVQKISAESTDGDNTQLKMHHGHDAHAAHRAAMKNKEYQVFETEYSLPLLDLVTSEGKKFPTSRILESNKPIAINFIFTTCTTICPVMTATFAQMRARLGDSANNLQMISITIDPEYDRPDVLRDYSENFNSGYDWLFLTGSSRDVFNLIKSFEAYHGSKMNHKPLTLLKKPGSKQFVRIEGLVSSSKLAQLIQEKLLH